MITEFVETEVEGDRFSREERIKKVERREEQDRKLRSAMCYGANRGKKAIEKQGGEKKARKDKAMERNT